MLAVKYWFFFVLLFLSPFLHFSFSLLVYFGPHLSLLPSGGRGSYNDMGGPVITTQVTIPKDVSTWQQPNMHTGTPKKDQSTSHTTPMS